jgi:hypothetical protein
MNMSKGIDGKEYYSFAEGLFLMSQKGMQGKSIRLSRYRVGVLVDMINVLEEHVPEHDSDNYCATLEWIRQQVRVRFPDIGIGIAGIKIELTKERAWILRDMIKIMEDYVPEGDYTQSVILEWLNQSINRLYSEFDLGMI